MPRKGRYSNPYSGSRIYRPERGDSGDTSIGGKAWNPINFPETWSPGGRFRGPSGSQGSGGFVKLLGYGFGAPTSGFAPMVRGYSLD